jgi:hypothetical protein
MKKLPPLTAIPDPDTGILVVSDHELLGGTKVRALPVLMKKGNEYVYASPTFGYAQLAIAATARNIGAKATIFVAERPKKGLYKVTRMAEAIGATIKIVPHGYLNVCQSAAKAYVEVTKAVLLPWGLNDPTFIDALAKVAASVPLKAQPKRVVCVAGSGVLTRALQKAFPRAKHYAIQVDHTLTDAEKGKAEVHVAKGSLETITKDFVPFDSCRNYDAKAWAFAVKLCKPGDLFWNVAGELPDPNEDAPAAAVAIYRPPAAALTAAPVAPKYSRMALAELTEIARENHQMAAGALGEALHYAKETGDVLRAIKAKVGHGKYGKWLAEHFEFTPQTANVYVRISEAWDHLKRISNLSVQGAIEVLRDMSKEQKKVAAPEVFAADEACKMLVAGLAKRFKRLPDAQVIWLAQNLAEVWEAIEGIKSRDLPRFEKPRKKARK